MKPLQFDRLEKRVYDALQRNFSHKIEKVENFTARTRPNAPFDPFKYQVGTLAEVTVLPGSSDYNPDLYVKVVRTDDKLTINGQTRQVYPTTYCQIYNDTSFLMYLEFIMIRLNSDFTWLYFDNQDIEMEEDDYSFNTLLYTWLVNHVRKHFVNEDITKEMKNKFDRLYDILNNVDHVELTKQLAIVIDTQTNEIHQLFHNSSISRTYDISSFAGVVNFVESFSSYLRSSTHYGHLSKHMLDILAIENAMWISMSGMNEYLKDKRDAYLKAEYHQSDFTATIDFNTNNVTLKYIDNWPNRVTLGTKPIPRPDNFGTLYDYFTDVIRHQWLPELGNVYRRQIVEKVYNWIISVFPYKQNQLIEMDEAKNTVSVAYKNVEYIFTCDNKTDVNLLHGGNIWCFFKTRVWDNNTQTYHDHHAFSGRIRLFDHSLMEHLEPILPLFNLASKLEEKLDGLVSGVYCSDNVYGTAQVCLNAVKRHDELCLYYSASHTKGDPEKGEISLEQKKFFLHVDELDKMCQLMVELDKLADTEDRSDSSDSRAIYEKAISFKQ